MPDPVDDAAVEGAHDVPSRVSPLSNVASAGTLLSASPGLSNPPVVRHANARAVVAALAEGGIDAPPMWRDNIAERTGLSVDEVSRVLDLLGGLVQRVAPRKNDEWALTMAGYVAAWLVDDELG